MNLNVSSDKDSQLLVGSPCVGQVDFWTVVLDAFFIILKHWKQLVLGPLVVGAIAFAGTFFLQKSYRSYAYLGPLDDSTIRKTAVLIGSPVILDAAFGKLKEQPFSTMTADEGRRYLAARIQFKPAMGDSKSGLYVMEATDSVPSRARDILNAVIDSWLTALKPSPEKRASLERLQSALEAQSIDVSSAIEQLLKHPEAPVADARTPYPSANVADMIKLRTDGIVRREELQKVIDGPGRDAIALPPTLPERPAGPRRLMIAFVATGGTLVVLIAILLIRGILLPAIANSVYGPMLRRLNSALWVRRPQT